MLSLVDVAAPAHMSGSIAVQLSGSHIDAACWPGLYMGSKQPVKPLPP